MREKSKQIGWLCVANWYDIFASDSHRFPAFRAAIAKHVLLRCGKGKEKLLIETSRKHNQLVVIRNE